MVLAVSSYVAQNGPTRHNGDMLTEALLHQRARKFPQTRLLVLGDLFADEFMVGEVTRISREAPVLILTHRSTRMVPGGAANAAANVASLGGQVEVIGLMGADRQADELCAVLEDRGVVTRWVVRDPQRPTTTKTRISAASQQSVTQQIVRMDRESRLPASPDIEQQLLAHLAARIPEVDGVLISDYGNGVVTDRIKTRCMALCMEHGKPAIVDSQGDLRTFRGAAVVTPNQPEAEAVVGFPFTDRTALERGGRLLLEEVQVALITRGSSGMALFQQGLPLVEIPAFNRSEVFDVTGAGDTVVGTMTLALLAGAEMLEAALWANLAASIVVRRFGTSTTTIKEMAAALGKLPTEVLPS